MMTRVAPSLPPVGGDDVREFVDPLFEAEMLDHDHVQQMEAKLKGMPKAGNKKILLDLRDVAAGDMAEATRLANFFLKDGTIAMLEGQKVQKQTFTADASKAINATAPVVVLVNRGTAGPAESLRRRCWITSGRSWSERRRLVKGLSRRRLSCRTALR